MMDVTKVLVNEAMEEITFSFNKISEEEMKLRREKWVPREPSVTTGYLARYREMVTSGNRGAILEAPKSGR